MAKYDLAFDLGQGQRKDNEDRYVRINIERFVKKGYFSKVTEANEFTTRFKNYSELFLSLYANDIITSEYVGEPFTLCYQGKNDKVWKHLGTNKFVSENKILFKDDAYLVERPTEEELKTSYDKLESQKYTPIDQKDTVRFNLTHELLGQELSIPRCWKYNEVPLSEQAHFDFLTKFTEEIRTIVNAKKRTSVYTNQPNYATYINYIESYNNSLMEYLNNAKKYGDVQSFNFYLPIIKIVHMLCIKKDDKAQTLKVDNTELFNLATFYLNFYSNRDRTFEKELRLLREGLLRLQNKKNQADIQEVLDQPEYVQIDMWGNEHPADEFDRRRRRRK